MQAYIGIELSDEAREVVVLKIRRQENAGKLRRVPHNEAVLGGAPRHDFVRRSIVHHVVRLQEKRRRPSAADASRRSYLHRSELEVVKDPRVWYVTKNPNLLDQI